MGKRNIILGLLAVYCLMCSACGAKTKAETSADFCVDATRLCGVFEGSEAYCATGLLRTYDNFMTFYEYDGGPSYPLCSAPYCEHEHLSAFMEDTSCEAALPRLRAAVIVGDMLYTFQEPVIGKTLVSKRNLLKSGYEQLAELPYRLVFADCGVYQEFTQDKAYLIMTDYKENISGLYRDSDYPCVYVEMDLKKGTYRVLFRIEDPKEEIYSVRRMDDGYCFYCMKLEGGEFIYDEQGNLKTDDAGNIQFEETEIYERFYFVDKKDLSVKEVSVMMPDDGKLKYTPVDYSAFGVDEFTVRELQGKPIFIGFGKEAIYAQQGNSIITVNPKTEEQQIVWTAPEGMLLSVSPLGRVDDFFSIGLKDQEQNIQPGILIHGTWEFHPYHLPENNAGRIYIGDGYFQCCLGVESGGMLYGYPTYNKFVYRLVSYEDIINGLEHYRLEWER